MIRSPADSQPPSKLSELRARALTRAFARDLDQSSFSEAIEALERGADPLTRIAPRGLLPLHIAAGRLRFDQDTQEPFESLALALIDRLLAAGSPVDCLDDRQRAPLLISALSNRPQRANALLRAGADPNSPDQEGLRPLHYAALCDNAEMALALLEAGADPGLCFSPNAPAASRILKSSVPAFASAWSEARELERSAPSPRSPARQAASI